MGGEKTFHFMHLHFSSRFFLDNYGLFYLTADLLGGGQEKGKHEGTFTHPPRGQLELPHSIIKQLGHGLEHRA